MTSSLRQRAQAAQDGDQPDIIAPTTDSSPDPGLAPMPDLPDGDATPEPAQVTVFVAWNRVMREVAGIAKSELYSAAGTRYNFRGVDRVVNAFGPALRRHGVIVVPIRVTPSHRDTQSAKNTAMRETTTVVDFRVFGPKGDYFDGQAEGESLDVSDKGAAKAQSIAERTFLLITGMVPTDEPDPDRTVHERGEARFDPNAYRDEALNQGTSVARLSQMLHDFKQLGRGAELVTNEVGDDEKLGSLVWRVRKERTQPSSGPGDAEEPS